MSELHKMFEPALIAAFEKFRKDQPDDIDQIEALKFILTDWFVAHRYLPLEDDGDAGVRLRKA